MSVVGQVAVIGGALVVIIILIICCYCCCCRSSQPNNQGMIVVRPAAVPSIMASTNVVYPMQPLAQGT